MTLIETLRERLADGRPFGFCPWEDGEGALWGTLLTLSESGFQVQRISPIGELEETEWRELSDMYSFDFGERYAERLFRLRDFSPTVPYDIEYLTDPISIERVLREVLASGKIAQVRVTPDDATSTVRVLSIEGEWVTMRDYDDLMEPYGVLVHRLSNISGVRAGTAYEEADEFVERAGL